MNQPAEVFQPLQDDDPRAVAGYRLAARLGPGATYETCRQLTSETEASHKLLLADKAAGSEICVKHRNGDIALMVIETKSTAMPDIGFVASDLTVWPAEKN
ncbi:hypothetical protein ACFYWD_09205 [Streptomyces sp. NPDC003781]|uniref:hypothetical protein n=1 Tax=Streptomyces sp. NPDC003781 TaxID=3364686 RepID=UPI003691FCA3